MKMHWKIFVDATTIKNSEKITKQFIDKLSINFDSLVVKFEQTLKDFGITPIKTLTRSPNLNPYAERVIRSIKYENEAMMAKLGQLDQPEGRMHGCMKQLSQ